MMDVSGLDWNSAVRFILQAVQEVSETKLAGEDLTNDVLKFEGQFSSTYISTATTTVVKTGAGLLHAIVVTETTAFTIIVYDNTAASGTILASFVASIAPGTYRFDALFTTGLTIITAGASKLTVVYR